MNIETDGYLERLHFDGGAMVRDANSCTIKMCKDREILSFCDKNCHNSCGPTGVFDVLTCTWNCDADIPFRDRMRLQVQINVARICLQCLAFW